MNTLFLRNRMATLRKRSSSLLVIGVFLFCAAPVVAQDSTRRALTMQVAGIQDLGTDKTLVSAVNEQNAKDLSLANLQRLDREWSVRAESFGRQLSSGACADRLRQFMLTKPIFDHVVVLDNKGAVVCASSTPPRYWWGNDVVWQRSYNNGQGSIFIDKPRSAAGGLKTAYVAFPVLDGGRTTGAISVAVKVDSLR